MARARGARASTRARAFLRGGAFERARTARAWPFLGLFAARDDDDDDARDDDGDDDGDDDDDARDVETAPRASSDGRVAYDRATLLRLRDAAASSGTPPGATEEAMRAYPWRARAEGERGATEDARDARGDAVTAAATARVVMETAAAARRAVGVARAGDVRRGRGARGGDAAGGVGARIER